MSYLIFRETENTGKTSKFDVLNTNITVRLGEIKWYAPWRRYAFFPTANTLFDSDCLKEIVSFVDGLMKKRKQQNKNFLNQSR